ncbi:hypothetical protein [Heyndrickxia camelliae]|nr:hypothetical protein [Heyndrickxia camelliae]
MTEQAKFTLTELIGYVEHVNHHHPSGEIRTVLKELLLLKEQLEHE